MPPPPGMPGREAEDMPEMMRIRTTTSSELYQRALGVLPGGVN